VVSLCLSLRCAVHTAIYPNAFGEDQSPRRGRRLHPARPMGHLRVAPRTWKLRLR
jgi:hypothetical protein